MLSHSIVSVVRQLRLIISLIFAAAALIVALSAGPAAQAAPPAAPAADGNVAIVDFAFNPSVVTITTGSSVQWTNTGSFTHTTTSNIGAWNSGDLGPGDIFSTTFTAPGTYTYHCAIHISMQGRVVVLTFVYLPLIMRS